MKALFFFKHFFRDLKNGELTLLAFIVFLTILGMSSALLFTAGVREGIENTAGTLLGGDRVLTSPQPLDASVLQLAKHYDLKTSQTLTFLSMLVHGEELALAEVKAVDSAFPLKGSIRAYPQLNEEEGTKNPTEINKDTEVYHEAKALSGIPKPGTVWLDPMLFTLLSLKMNDQVTIGNATFTVAAVLGFEPGRAGERLMLAPRAMMNREDVEKTGVIQTGSRETYNIYLSGNQKALQAFESQMIPKLNPTQRIIHATEGSMKNVFEQGESYIRVILIINFILAMLALSQIAQFFFKKQQRLVSLLRCFGADLQWLSFRLLSQVLFISLLAGSLGFLMALTAVRVAQKHLEKTFNFGIEMVWWSPLGLSFLILLVLLLVSVLPPLRELRALSPLNVLRSQDAPNVAGMSRMGDTLKRFLIKIFGGFGVGFRYGVSNLTRYLSGNIIQILAFSLIFMGLGLLWLLRTDLVQSWHKEIPMNAPNYFVINLGKEEGEAFQEMLQKDNIQYQGLYPIVRGRLLSKPQMQRLLNITYSNVLPKDNKILAGNWFSVGEETKEKKKKDALTPVSLEQGFAERMQIGLGDFLEFQFGDKNIAAQVASIRTVDWNSFHPNFFVIFPPGILEGLPYTLMTSFYVPPQKRPILKSLVQTFPSISLIDISALINYLMKIVGALSVGIEYLFAFTLSMAFLFFLCSIRVTLDERKKAAVIFRALGASHKRLGSLLLTEFMILGLISGILAGLGAIFAYAWLMKFVFKLPFELPYRLLIVGPLLTTALIVLGGFLGIRKSFRLSPARILSSRSGY